MMLALRRMGYLALILGMGGYAYLSLKGPQGLPTLFEKRQRIHQLEEKNRQLQAEIDRHRREIEQLERNPSYMDDVLRMEFNYTQPNDLEFKVPRRTPEPPPAPDGPRSPAATFR